MGFEQVKRSVMLNVPFEQKDEAKQLGARWDPDLRKWFVPEGVDPKPFRKWFSSDEQNAR